MPLGSHIPFHEDNFFPQSEYSQRYFHSATASLSKQRRLPYRWGTYGRSLLDGGPCFEH